MKLRTILVCFLIGCGLAMQAQDYKVISMESLPTDMTAREDIKTDGNGKQCAVLRIATQNITPEQREGFFFECDWGSYVVQKSIIDGEIRVWVSPGLKTLKIKHSKLGQWELHTAHYGINVEALHTYKVVIQGTMKYADEPEEVTQQYLAFRISPANATLFVNDEIWEVGADGTAVKFVNFGTYNYRVMAPNHVTQTGTVTVNDPENTQTVPVTLQSDFVEVTLKVDADAEIWVNNEKKGTRTWTGQLGKGTYKIECKQANYQSTVTTQEINENKTITLPAPKPIYGSLNVESTPSFATVYIDGKLVGETPKFVKEILVGEHKVKLTKEGYKDYLKTVTITKGERASVMASLEADGTAPVAQQDVKPMKQKPDNKQPASNVFFVMANAAYSIAPQASFGLTAGSVKKLGWYASLGSNFKFKSANYECDYSGVINGTDMEYSYSGEKSTSRFGATAGMVIRVYDPIYAYVGGGYGFRNVFWELENGSWAKCTDDSYQGIALDAGLMLHFGGFGFSLGVQTIGFSYMEAKIGLGYTLKR